tara:strand:+ start:436 stop:1308 length:873 start_codon:yes stop_codon:yes gene_type:complete
MKTIGLVLAGGMGSRLYPATLFQSKQILPVYDKPMIYYPMSVLIEIGIRDFIIIIKKQDLNVFKKLDFLKKFNLNIKYVIQNKPNGIAEVFILTKKYIKNNNTCLILGDNLFHGNNLIEILVNAKEKLQNNNSAQIFANYVKNPSNYGVIEFEKNHKIIRIIEKPKKTNSNYAIPGIYFFPQDVIDKVKLLKPSKRNELEIVDLQTIYLKENRLSVNIFDKNTVWFDTGTIDSLNQASSFVQSIENRHGIKIGAIEEVCYRNNLIKRKEYLEYLKKFKNIKYYNDLNQNL